MSINKSLSAFEDVREIFERALNSPKGILITCGNRGKAVVLRQRFNYFRKLNRDENKTIYPTDHPMWGKSSYDHLTLKVPPKGTPGDNILYIGPRTIEEFLITEITE